MTTNNPNGGPAFPIPAPQGDWKMGGVGGFHAFTGESGMSLRDWFAGQALAGQLASLSNAEVVKLVQDSMRDPFEWAASSAYDYADAMLAKREKSE